LNVTVRDRCDFSPEAALVPSGAVHKNVHKAVRKCSQTKQTTTNNLKRKLLKTLTELRLGNLCFIHLSNGPCIRFYHGHDLISPRQALMALTQVT